MKIKNNRIYFPKFKEGMYFRGSEKKLSEIKDINQIFVTKEAGYYFCSITYEADNEFPEKKPLAAENSVGVDLGAEKFAALSSGIAIENPRFLMKMEKRIKSSQKGLSRKKKGSKNRKKRKKNSEEIHETEK